MEVLADFSLRYRGGSPSVRERGCTVAEEVIKDEEDEDDVEDEVVEYGALAPLV